MRIIEPKVYVVNKGRDSRADLKELERLARVPYASEGNITEDSYAEFIQRLVKREHMAMMEFEDLTFIVRCDRGVTHELVRHRMASFAQESTRYCNYSNNQFGNEIAVIRPFFFRPDTEELDTWRKGCAFAEGTYLSLLSAGASAQEARSVLPNSTKAIIVIKMNYRELLHFFGLRCAPTAHPQMRQVAIPLARYCRNNWPSVFGQIPELTLPVSYGIRGELCEGDLAELQVLGDLKDWPDEL